MGMRSLQILVAQKNKYQSVLLEREISYFFDSATVKIISTLDELLFHMKNKYFDSVVVDCEIIDIETKEFLKILKEQYFKSPIIFLTDDSSAENVRNLKLGGIEKMLVKNESSYVAVPRLIKEIISDKIWDKRVERRNLKSRVSNSVKKDSVGILSHEINNPLMTILGISELIMENGYKYDRQLLEKIRMIQKSAQRIEKSLVVLRKNSNSESENKDCDNIFKRKITKEFVKN